MKHSILLLVMALVTTAGCVSSKESDNPFLSEYKTPFGVPPFDEIKVQHYQPAIEAGIQEQNREIEQIISNEEPASFENTILAYDQSGRLLNKTTLVFYNIRSANTNDELLAVAREVTPILTSHRDNIALNEALFQRIKTVYNERYDSDLDSSQIRVVEKYYSDFERNGANLAQDAQKRLREINNDLSMLTLQFGENSLAETNKNFRLVVESEDDLSGLSEAIKEAAAVTAKELGEEGKWVFTVQKPSMLPFLSYSDRRNLREKLYKGYYMRGDNDNNNDNKEIIEKMVALRSEKAKLLGYANHAEFVIDVNMAKTPENVYDFLYKLWDPALKRAKSELVELQKIANREGNDFKIKSWDWWYYAEKLRKEKYDLDESLLSPYLALDNVREGMFWVANQLYGISFYKLSDVPVYHPDVEVFEVKEENGDHIGLLYLDYFPRDGKGAGAWCSSFRRASYDDDVRIHPISTITCNFTKPTATTPSLLSWEETTTLFHEFGHALHGLF
ncbi:MAG TPA: M3 family metallopeptidase, partial [Marinilabiliaceae bacterium]|nr:M3 family metallopeptidase [Marinilabiliaceae bacterium]